MKLINPRENNVLIIGDFNAIPKPNNAIKQNTQYTKYLIQKFNKYYLPTIEKNYSTHGAIFTNRKTNTHTIHQRMQRD